jgi:predicted amidophosphoribosyltransferase
MKACPFCAEAIQDAAILCPHCGKTIADANPWTKKRGFGTFLALLAALFGIAAVASQCP